MLKAFRLHPVHRESLNDLLERVWQADVQLEVAIPSKELHIGPWRRQVPMGHWAELNLEIRAGVLLREQARGRIEPPLPLPLGFKMCGLSLSPQGEVLASVRGLPSVNLHRLAPSVPPIPGTMQELVDVLRGIRSSGPQRQDVPSPSPGVPGPSPAQEARPSTDLADEASSDQGVAHRLRRAPIRWRLTEIKPRPECWVDLGKAGCIQLGPDTVLQIEKQTGHTEVRGHVHVLDGTLKGPSLVAEGVSGRAQIGLERRGRGRRTELKESVLSFSRFDAAAEEGDFALRGAELETESLTVHSNEERWQAEGSLQLAGRGRVSSRSPRWRHEADGDCHRLVMDFGV